MDGIRSVLGVGLGFVVFVIGSAMPRGATGDGATPSVGLVVGSIVYGAVFAALGGLTAASLAGRKQLLHGAALAALIAVVALLHPWLEVATNPRWLDLCAAFLMAPFAALAGWARGRLHPR